MQSIDTSRYHPLEAVYDQYAALLFPILIDSCQSREHAEKVLEMTFSELPNHELMRTGKPVSLITLVRLGLANARRLGCNRNNFSLRPFKHSPLLHQLIVHEGRQETICDQLAMSRTEFAKQLRLEIKSTSRNIAHL